MTPASARWRPTQLTLAAGTVGLAYYAGVQIAAALAFPPVYMISVLSPPSAILTAAFLLLPMRHWWLCVAVALPVHWLPESGTDQPALLALAAFGASCLEGLIAACGVRLLNDEPTKLDSFRRVAAFIGAAAFAAPALSSFAHAAVVSNALAQPYWQVWGLRTFSSVLAQLSVVPVILLVADVVRGGVRPASSARWLEACLFGLCVVVAALWVFGEPNMPRIPAIPPTPSMLLLPFYFWAAVRFGVGAISGALLITAVVASYEAHLGNRPFSSVLAPAESLLAIQVYLAVMSVPLMCVAGLLQERRELVSDLSARLAFRRLLKDISGRFVEQPADTAFPASLRQLGEYFDADYVGVQNLGDTGALRVEWQWHRNHGHPTEDAHCPQRYPWTYARVREGQAVIVSSIEAFPARATLDRESFRAARTHAAAVLPLLAAGRVEGALAVVWARPRTASWNEEQLAFAAEVIASALARRSAELALQRGRQKIAAMARLSIMGELTASLAHQINQPLTGISNNAEAGRRFIDSGRATLPQLREILVDILEDNQRAAGVIRRVRDILGRSEWSPRELDANTLVQEVADLLASDAVLRNVSLAWALAPGPLPVHGNRVDLEQVVLNVVSNAMDAVADKPIPERQVTIETRSADRDVELVIRDRGEGFPAGFEERIFEPFVTTKPHGTGMGLAVARSVLENHGGSICAANHPEGGAVVTITLPAASRAA